MLLDHLVINTRFETDTAARQFEALGFTLTPRGYHTLGSINHLIMFGDHYLELIGLPTGTDRLRPDVLSSPGGIDGLVFRTHDPDATAVELQSRGFAVTPAQRFSRPVEIDGQTRDASFVTVRLLPDQVAAGRVYYCQHLTPELVWHPPWLQHANGVTGMPALVVVGHDTDALRRQYQLLDVDETTRTAPFSVEFETAESFALRFGELAHMAPVLASNADEVGDAPSDPAAPRAGFFGAITLRLSDDAALAAIETRARSAGLPACRVSGAQSGTGERVIIALPAFSTLLECRT